jgi:hypothetical protein
LDSFKVVIYEYNFSILIAIFDFSCNYLFFYICKSLIVCFRFPIEISLVSIWLLMSSYLSLMFSRLIIFYLFFESYFYFSKSEFFKSSIVYSIEDNLFLRLLIVLVYSSFLEDRILKDSLSFSRSLTFLFSSYILNR